jgi:hypothetical protein
MRRFLRLTGILIATLALVGYGTVDYMKSTPPQPGDFDRTEIIQSQDHFADPHNNPNGTYLSTNTAFWDGVRDGFDYAINVPIEFFAAHTDTLFSHAMFNFESFPTYDRYEPIDSPDSSVPYTREFDVEGTTVIYNGVPAGDYNKPIIEAYALALDSILSQGLEPVTMTASESEI